jgi:NAD(P)-dependent dehydrogenase (short-subunit alcohol dehydrogenase family)
VLIAGASKGIGHSVASDLVNNVGLVRPAMIGAVDLDDLADVYDLNVRIAVQVTQAVSAASGSRTSSRPPSASCSPRTPASSPARTCGWTAAAASTRPEFIVAVAA